MAGFRRSGAEACDRASHKLSLGSRKALNTNFVPELTTGGGKKARVDHIAISVGTSGTHFHFDAVSTLVSRDTSESRL